MSTTKPSYDTTHVVSRSPLDHTVDPNSSDNRDLCLSPLAIHKLQAKVICRVQFSAYADSKITSGLLIGLDSFGDILKRLPPSSHPKVSI